MSILGAAASAVCGVGAVWPASHARRRLASEQERSQAEDQDDIVRRKMASNPENEPLARTNGILPRHPGADYPFPVHSRIMMAAQGLRKSGGAPEGEIALHSSV